MGDYIIVGMLYMALAVMTIKMHFNRKRNSREWTKNMRPVGRQYSGRW